MSQLNGKVALVTGGGTGIGKSITELFVEAGARVVITGRRAEPLAALAAQYPEQIKTFQADVTKPGDPKRALAFAVDTFGQLDILVNNAGAFIGKPFAETTDDEINQLLQVNVLGVAAFSREAIPALAATKGVIINTSSVVATGIMPGNSVYSAAKAAVDHLTRTLAAELGALGIRVNTVSPGVTSTDMVAGMLSHDETRSQITQMTPLGRIGEPADIARVVRLLATEEAGWVTGQVVAASGGLLL